MNRCTAWHEELVAYADHAVDDRCRDAIARHLVGCESCRAELAALQGVRHVVATTPAPAAAPAGLADRLVAIAGEDAGRELCLRRERTSCLPSDRARRRQRTLLGASGAVLALGGLLGAAWLSAPGLRPVDDADGSSISPWQASAALLSSDQMPTPTCPPEFHCPDWLQGLRLVEFVPNRPIAPSAVKLVYSDDDETVIVVQQRGVLASPQPATAQRRVWQSSDVVICVHGSDGPTTDEAVEALPHDAPVDNGLDRVRAGLRSLAGRRGR